MSDAWTDWRCSKDNALRCPPEGCPKRAIVCGAVIPYGCSRNKGWRPGQPSPLEVQGIDPEQVLAEILTATLTP